jgi:hypothetical protein
MSLFSSIAHPGTAKTRGFPLRGMAVIAMALVVGAAVGAAVDGGGASDTSEASVVVSTRLPHDEFIRLNTTDMDHLSPAATASAVESAPSVDPFLYWNTIALDNLVPSAKADPAESQLSDEFLRWNIDSLEYAEAKYSEPVSGPR